MEFIVNKLLHDNSGFSLIEAIVAMVLVLILVGAFAGALTLGLRTETEVDMSLKAGDLAETKMEYLSANREDLNNTNDIDWGDILEDEENENDEFDLYEFWDNRVTDTDIDVSNDDNNLKTVTIVVEWEEGGDDWQYELVSRMIGPEEENDD